MIEIRISLKFLHGCWCWSLIFEVISAWVCGVFIGKKKPRIKLDLKKGRNPAGIRTRLRLSSTFELHKRPKETTKPNLEKRKEKIWDWCPRLFLLPLIYGQKSLKKFLKYLIFICFFSLNLNIFNTVWTICVFSKFIKVEMKFCR